MHCRSFRSVVAAGALCVPAALVADPVMEGGEVATDGAFVVRSFTNTAVIFFKTFFKFTASYYYIL